MILHLLYDLIRFLMCFGAIESHVVWDMLSGGEG